MKHLFSLLYFISFIFYCDGQKLSIDTGSLDKWPYLDDNKTAISNDGNYSSYVIRNQPVGKGTLVIQATNNSWRKEYVGAGEGMFSRDSKQVFFMLRDTLCFLVLGTDKFSFVQHVNSWKWPEAKNSEWLAYQLKGPDKELILVNLYTSKEKKFSSIVDYAFDKQGNNLILKSEVRNGSNSTISLLFLELWQGKSIKIWSTANISSKKYNINRIIFDEAGKQIAFTVTEEIGSAALNSIWYYKAGTDSAVKWVDNNSAGIDSGLSINNFLIWFSKNGRWIFFELKGAVINVAPVANSVQVDVWSYKDVALQPMQMSLLKRSFQLFFAVISTESRKEVRRIENENERMLTYPNIVTGDYVVIADKCFYHQFAEYWQPLSLQPSYYLMSLNSGTRRLLKKEDNSLSDFSFSPHCKYLVYYDFKLRNYFSYDIMADTIRNITKRIPTKVNNESWLGSVFYPPVSSLVGWQTQDSTIMIYDNFDLWRINPSGRGDLDNVTKGYGLANHIKFRLLEAKENNRDLITFKDSDTLFLTAFDPRNKYNGFFKIVLGQKTVPERLTLGPYLYYCTDSQLPQRPNTFDQGMTPIKAASANAWIVKRETASEAPNYFFTQDFIVYVPLSHLRPQADFNWLTANLLEWRQFDGTVTQGILYKPENFDPRIKYPVIFNYYEQMSHRLYEFPYPKTIEANIDIPWFVSHGYLVFTPDIHYRIAHKTYATVGECAYNSVISAAEYLAKMPFVDSKKMGIQGHSFGGGETNYLVTHTHLFAAAAEAAGDSDPISAYLTLVPGGEFSIDLYSKQVTFETTYNQFEATPWKVPDLYQKTSAVLFANRVSTPLLIMHNMLDDQIQWRQGVEFYMALRRLGKRVWMLQYDKGSHTIQGREAMDYTIRLTQFFDYYLKNTLPPKWMSEGIPAKLKGIINGYDLDPRPGAIP